MSAARTFHGSLLAATPGQATLDNPYQSIKVINRTAGADANANEIYFTVDGSAPTVGAAGTYVVAGHYGAEEVVPVPLSVYGAQPNGGAQKPFVINLVSTNATSFSVVGM